jgi:molybdopterin molybdotransferase/putative molybdopterin biosynthesis protein
MKLPTKKEALTLLLEKWAPKAEAESIPLEEAYGRVLARDVFARLTLPVVRAAAMDSVALSSERFRGGAPDTRTWRLGIDCERADMGDDFDDRFDCALPVESVKFLPDGGIEIAGDAAVTAGAGVRKAGSAVKEGDLLLVKGRRVTPSDLAVLAIGGADCVDVLKKPVVAVIPTGSELVMRGQKPGRGQNIDANSLMLEKLLTEMGADAACGPIIRDPAAIAQAMYGALETADIVVLNGGTSMGSEDFTAGLPGEKGETLFHGVAAAPGRPLGVTLIGGKPVVSLPGPPAAAFAVADWCLRAMIARFLDIPPAKRQTVRAVLTETLETPLQMEFTARVIVRKAPDGSYLAEPVSMGNQSLARVMAANALFISPIGLSRFDRGTELELQLLRGEEEI